MFLNVLSRGDARADIPLGESESFPRAAPSLRDIYTLRHGRYFAAGTCSSRNVSGSMRGSAARKIDLACIEFRILKQRVTLYIFVITFILQNFIIL